MNSEKLVQLLQAILAHEPAHAPTITSGEETAHAWLDKKEIVASVSSLRNERLIAYCGLQRSESRHGQYELCRLLIDPEFRRRGLASALVEELTSLTNEPIWASAVAGSAGHKFFLHLNWIEADSIAYSDDPAPGVVLVPNRAVSPPKMT